MNNLRLFEFCRQNPERSLDPAYMFVEKHPKLPLYVKNTKKIKELLITIKTLHKKKSSEATLNPIFQDLQKALRKDANYSEFGAFINACDSYIDSVKQDLGLLKKVTGIYLQKRDLNEIVPAEWIQALVDKGSARMKGAAGEYKLVRILEAKKYVFADTFQKFQNYEKAVARSSSSGDFSNEGIKRNFRISIGKGTQDKRLDLVIKNRHDIYFVEAKHINTSGGGQNKQVSELINVLRKDVHNKCYHFVAFLDGVYSNILLEAGLGTTSKKAKNKAQKQKHDILSILKQRSSNYWANTAGFEKLFSLSSILKA